MRSPAKRSRICTSPSSGVAAFMIRQLPPRAPEPSDRRRGNFGKATKNSPKEQQPSAAILTVSSPEIVRSEPPATACADQFLEECYFCRKRISDNSDVSMYGPFGALCSEVCRSQQINKDKVAQASTF